MKPPFQRPIFSAILQFFSYDIAQHHHITRLGNIIIGACGKCLVHITYYTFGSEHEHWYALCFPSALKLG